MADSTAEKAGRVVPRATHAGTIRLGTIEIPCAVLEDGRRVLTQAGFLRALGMNAKPTRANVRVDKMPPWLGAGNLNPFIDEDLRRNVSAFNFTTLAEGVQGGGSRLAVAVEATLLPKVCAVYAKLKAADKATKHQDHVATRCIIMLAAFAQVGIAALVDEACGCQDRRDHNALQALLDAYLNREFADYEKRFPPEFYKEIFRLNNWNWNSANPAGGPRCVAQMTDDIVYRRLNAPVLAEMRRRNPVREDGSRLAKHHQLLTPSVGIDALDKHLHALTGLMRASKTWLAFKGLLDAAFPAHGDDDGQMLFPFGAPEMN